MKTPIDVLRQTVTAEEEVARKIALFLKTPAGVELQVKQNKGVLDEVAYDQEFNRLFSEFLKNFDSARRAA